MPMLTIRSSDERPGRGASLLVLAGLFPALAVAAAAAYLSLAPTAVVVREYALAGPRCRADDQLKVARSPIVYLPVASPAATWTGREVGHLGPFRLFRYDDRIPIIW